MSDISNRTKAAKSNELVWIDDPKKYSYVRLKHFISLSSIFPVKTFPKKYKGLLIGYKLVKKEDGKNGKKLYHYEIYWLKNHDRELQPDGPYKGEFGFTGKIPAEAVDPKSLDCQGSL